MNDFDGADWTVAGLIVLLIGTLIIVFTAAAVSGNWRNDAVDRGHAEYYLDAKHERQWRWRTNCVHDVWLNPPAEAKEHP